LITELLTEGNVVFAVKLGTEEIVLGVEESVPLKLKLGRPVDSTVEEDDHESVKFEEKLGDMDGVPLEVSTDAVEFTIGLGILEPVELLGYEDEVTSTGELEVAEN
jgi:hypothetical protein